MSGLREEIHGMDALNLIGALRHAQPFQIARQYRIFTNATPWVTMYASAARVREPIFRHKKARP